jgi:hypothetical protein
MRDSWLRLVGSVLRPARPRLLPCLQERERHLDAQRLFAERRAREVAACEARIEAIRAEVFAANDGVVTSRMTDLEREWRRLTRVDLDAGLMDLWARIVPSAWIDRKPWRDADPAARLDLAIALAADVEGVEAVEAAIGALRASGTKVGARVRWRTFERDFEGTPELLATALHAARERVSASALDRARHLERDVHEAALVRFPERPTLARALSHAAFVECVCGLAGRPNPVTSLRDLWRAGYALSALDASGVTVEVPPL